MKFGIFIHFKDEFELLATNLKYHASLGFDFFVLLNMGSNKDTINRLNHFLKGALSINEKNTLIIHQEVTLDDIVTNRAAKMRIDFLKETKAVFPSLEWLFFCDTDEFLLLPERQSLQDMKDFQSNDTLRVNRFNAALSHAEIFPAEINSNYLACTNIIVQPNKRFNELEDKASIPWIMTSIGKKTFLRLDVNGIKRTIAGYHNIKYSTPKIEQENETMVIIHYPFTDFDRFKTKVRNIQKLGYGTDKDKEVRIAWHWKYWSTLKEDKSILEEFERQFFTPLTLEKLLQEKIVIPAAQFNQATCV